jgi:hypothetical protein
MIKVKATPAKEASVSIGMNLRSSQILLAHLGNAVGCDHKIDGANDDEVDDVLLGVRQGLEDAEVGAVEYLEDREDGEVVHGVFRKYFKEDGE